MPKTILCYGDSNTYGYEPVTKGRYPKEQRWTTILGKLLGEEYEVIPEGLNGRTTAYDVPDFFWRNGLPYLLPCIGSHKPVDLVVLMLGSNDCKNFMGLSAEDITAGLEKLIQVIQNQTPLLRMEVPRILVVVPAEIQPEIAELEDKPDMDASSARKSREIAPLYKALAEKYGCEYLNASEYIRVSDVDYLHLTAEAHQRLAEVLAEKIPGILK